FVAFGAEELGLYGSRAYVHELSADDRNFMLGMVNLDMEGFGDRWRSTGDAKLVDLSLAAAKLAGIEAQSFTLPEGVGSDHQSFLQANIPAVFPAMVDDPLFHTPQDTADRISPANLQNAGRWAIAILAEMTK
ncbi:MAG: M28 family peptidase, partial [Chloroflexi bacterium]|nr:M28 family peptidase [Chloroflexota bacterium]